MTPEQALPLLYRKKERRRELAVGAFVLLGGLLALGLLFVLTDPALFRGRFHVSTVVPDAGGLRRGDPVQMRGVNVGRVRDFSLTPEGVRIELEVDGEFEIPADSRVELISGGLLGGKIASIVPGTSQETASRGGVLSGAVQEDPFQQASSIAAQAETTLERVQALLSEQNVASAGSSLQSLEQTLAQMQALVAEQRGEVAALTKSLRQSATGLEAAVGGPELERTVKRLDTLSARLMETTGSIERSAESLETVMGRLERGEGTLGRLTRDESLFVNANEAAARMNEAAVEMRGLIQDIKKNPKRYIDLSIF